MGEKNDQVMEALRAMRLAYERAGVEVPPSLEEDLGKRKQDDKGGDANKDQEPGGHGEGEGEGKSESDGHGEGEGEGKSEGEGEDEAQGKGEGEGEGDQEPKEEQSKDQKKQRRPRRPKPKPEPLPPPTPEESRHPLMQDLYIVVKSDIPAMLVGPAGSGKTTACAMVADLLKIPFYAQSFCAQTSLSQLIGYKDAVGVYHPSIFRMAFEHGGVFLGDEIDAGNPNITAFLNAAISNGFCSFPDAMVKRHKDFRMVAAANTFGNGKTIEYIGRNPIDAATLDRFVQILWPYDDEFEAKIAPYKKWLDIVRVFRKSVADRGLRHIISPRASLYGTKLLHSGMKLKTVVEITLIKGMEESVKKAILSMPEVKQALVDYSKVDEPIPELPKAVERDHVDVTLDEVVAG